MKILELFSGTESFSKVAKARGHEVFTIDNCKKFNPDLWMDILHLDISMIPFKPDIIWASPPCTEYSHAKRVGIRKIKEANKIVMKTIELIKQLEPEFWIIENPQTGLLKNQKLMVNLPFTDCSYCKYGMPYRKQTRFWNNFNLKLKTCNKDCKFMDGNKHISSVGNGRDKWHKRELGNHAGSFKLKYKVPKKLCLEIIKQCEDKFK